MDRLVLLKGGRKSAFGFKTPKPPPEPSRDDRIKAARLEGRTFHDIAEEFDLSYVRIQQICKTLKKLEK